MMVGQLFAPSHDPAPADIVKREAAKARASFPNADDDLQALAFAASALSKNLAERTAERDRYRKERNELLNAIASRTPVQPSGE